MRTAGPIARVNAGRWDNQGLHQPLSLRFDPAFQLCPLAPDYIFPLRLTSHQSHLSAGKMSSPADDGDEELQVGNHPGPTQV